MLYNYEIKYSDGTVSRNVYSMKEQDVFRVVGKNVYETLFGKKGLSVLSVKVIGVSEYR